MFDRVPDNLETIPPGPELARVLGDVDWEHLSGYNLVRVLQAQDRQISHYEAARCWTMERIVAIYQDGCRDESLDYHEAQDGAAAEIGAALRLTRSAADGATAFAVELCRHHPRVFEALLFGQIDLRRARILVDGTQVVSRAVADDVIGQLLPVASGLTTSQLRHRLQKMCLDADPEAAGKRYESAREDRRVEVRANDCGTSDILGRDLDPEDAAQINAWIHQQAIQLRRRGDKRTLDQIRADIYVDLLKRRHLQINHGSKGGGVHLDTTLEGLAGLTESSGELNGYQPVVADIARQVASHQANSEWTWTLRDPDTGQPIDGGTTRRRPTTAQRRYAHAAHRTCVHPGCRQPAVTCDIDHRIPWQHRKVTCTGDLAPFCRYHHTIRHTFGWSYQLVDGDAIFTTPLGHRYTASGRPP
jgi:hypothetical protein